MGAIYPNGTFCTKFYEKEIGKDLNKLSTKNKTLCQDHLK